MLYTKKTVLIACCVAFALGTAAMALAAGVVHVDPDRPVEAAVRQRRGVGVDRVGQGRGDGQGDGRVLVADRRFDRQRRRVGHGRQFRLRQLGPARLPALAPGGQGAGARWAVPGTDTIPVDVRGVPVGLIVCADAYVPGPAAQAALVTYDNGGCRDYARDGETALVARRRDVDDLAGKLAAGALPPEKAAVAPQLIFNQRLGVEKDQSVAKSAQGTARLVYRPHKLGQVHKGDCRHRVESATERGQPYLTAIS